MLKTRKRWVALLVAVAMVAVLVVPFAGTASASTTYSVTNVATVTSPSIASPATNPAGWANIGDLVVTMDPATAQSLNGTNSSFLYVQMPTTPTGYKISVQTLQTEAGVATSVYASVGLIGANTGSYSAYLTFTTNPDYFQVTFPTPVTAGSGSSSIQFSLPLSIFVPSGVTGNVQATVSAPGSSLLASGQVVIASVGSAGLTLAESGTTAISSSGGTVGTIDITENAADSLNNAAAGGTPLELTLPPGFSWITPTAANIQFMWGDQNLISNALGAGGADTGVLGNISTSNDGRELDIGSTYASTSATYFQLTPSVTVDEATALTGNITVTVGGSSTSNVSSVVVGTYGQYGATVKAQSAPAIIAGQTGDTIGELGIIEGIPGSLIAGRTITLTLPTNAVWSGYPSIDTSLSTNYGTLSVQSEMVGTNGNIMQLTVNGTTTGQSAAGNLYLKNFDVSTAVNFSGPLVVTVGGSEGLTGTLTLATVTAPLTVTAASAPSILIGQANQALGNLTITEGSAGALSGVTYYTAIDTNSALETQGGDYGLAIDQSTNTEPNLYLVAPEGVTFDTTPTVTVSSGNLQLGTVTTETSDSYLDVNNEGVIVIPVQASSTTASTITVSGITITVDNTVPEGPVVLKVEGPAVNQETDTNIDGQAQVISPESSAANLEAPFPNSTDAAVATVGTVTNGVSTSTSTTGTAVFTIGSTSYALNGSTVSMDVAPYIQDSRTFLPLRYIANAVGVADSNILWNPTTQSVTIIKGGVVAQFTIGSTTMILNGASVTMDVAPQITDGRTCLPVAWVAEALGAQIAWNATAQTATVTF